MKEILFGLILILSSAVAAADEFLETRTVLRILSENQTTAGFYTKEGLTQCKWGIMFIDLSSEAGRAQFSMILTAKVAGQKIIRMNYIISSEKCRLTGLHTQ